jgi:hypothetical protein
MHFFIHCCTTYFSPAIPFSDNVSSILNTVSAYCQRDLDIELQLSYEDDKTRQDWIVVTAEISGLPGAIQFDLNTQNNAFRIINPRYIKKE